VAKAIDTATLDGNYVEMKARIGSVPGVDIVPRGSFEIKRGKLWMRSVCECIAHD